MKVIQISSFFGPSVGGVEKQVQGITENLTKNGIDVEVFTTDASHGTENRISKIEIRSEQHYPILTFKYWLRLGYFFRFSPLLLFKLLFSDWDIVHVHNTHDAHLLGAILIKMLRRKKLVLTGHNPYVVDESKRGSGLSAGVKIFEFFLKILIKKVDAYIALLDSEKAFVVKHFHLDSKRVFVIPNGIQDIFFEKEDTKESFNNEETSKHKMIVGCVCRMDYVKGIQNLETAVKNLPEVMFIFAGGDGGYMSELKEIYKGCKNVYFTERYLSPKEVKKFYDYIDIFLLPSNYEPFGITLVEAMTQGKFILASNVGGAPEIVKRDFGELIEPTDQNKWKERIEYCLMHKEEVKAKGETARVSADKYKWENVIKNIIKVYNQV